MLQGQQNPDEKEEPYRSIFDAAADGLIISHLESCRVVEANSAACRMHGYTYQGFIGLHLTDFIHPGSQQSFLEAARALQPDTVFNIRTLHVRQDGSTFHAEWVGTLYTFQGKPCLLGNVRNVSERIQAEQLLRRNVETRDHEQTALLAISHALAASLEFQPGLILEQLREIIEFKHVGLFALEDSTLVTLAMRGTPALEISQPCRVHLQGAEALAMLFNGHQPIRIANIGEDNPQTQFLRSLLVDETAELLTGMHSWMWVPLAVKNRIIGGLGVAHEKRNFFTPHHADLALSVANQAAISMINTELYKNAQSLAALQERQRLAQNLHDAINQSLFSASLIAEVLPRLWDRDQTLALQSLEDLRKLTRGAMAEMRALLAELRPTTLTDADLGDLLQLLGNTFTGRTNVQVTVTIDGEGVLPADVQVTMYRVCQEALNNVAKHARASQVEIHLKYDGPVVEITILDNGQGFDPHLTVSGHYGLSMMHERAEAVGAQLSVASQQGHGTEVSIRWLNTLHQQVP